MYRCRDAAASGALCCSDREETEVKGDSKEGCKFDALSVNFNSARQCN